MPTFDATFQSIPGTEAALGRAGGHTVVADRLDGTAGGMGIGFNGGELLALALGGCLSNDIRYAAHALGVDVEDISISVSVDFEGTPLVARSARLNVDCTGASDEDIARVVEQAWAGSAVANSLKAGFPVTIG